MKTKKIFLFWGIVFTFISFSQIAFAHQPRLIWEAVSSSNYPIIINNYDVSQAFYGIFKNSPEYYKVNVKQLSDFHISLLVPDNSNAAVGVSAKVIALNSTDSDTKIFLNGNKSEWKVYYEEFAGDFYLQGPEGERYLKPGEYLIEVSAEKNEGKYVLVVGQKESFPVGEAIRMILSLSKLKLVFFEEPIYMLAAGILGKLMASLLLFLLLLALMSLRKIREKKTK